MKALLAALARSCLPAALPLFLIGCAGAAPDPSAAVVADAAAAMPAWVDDPLRAAAEQPVTCAAIADLATGPRARSRAAARGIAAAIGHFAASCREYGRALASYPLDRLRRERYWHESLKEGVMVASDYWRDELAASERRLQELGARWQDATREAEHERALGCAALASTGRQGEDPRRAGRPCCPQ